MKLTIQGLADAEKTIEGIKAGIERTRGRSVTVGTRLPYGYGQEFGHHRKSGRLARRGGGAMYLTRGLAQMQADADRDISEGLKRVRRPGLWILRRLGRWTRRLARMIVPRQKGRLLRSIQVFVDGKRSGR